MDGFWKSLVSHTVASMALQATGVVDVIATRTTPIIWTRNVTLTPRFVLL